MHLLVNYMKYVCTGMYACMYVCIHTSYILLCVDYVCMYVKIICLESSQSHDMCACVCVCVCVRMYVCMYMYIVVCRHHV
jgi:hypothetical protein